MAEISTATRIIYWNIHGIWLMYVLLVPAMAIFAYGVYRRYRLWTSLGKKTERLDRPRDRVRRVLTYALGHKRFFKDGPAAVMHTMIFWSMLLLFLGTTVVAIDEDLRIPIMHGWFYLIFQKLILNFAGLFLLVGSAYAIYRRYGAKVARVQPNREGVPVDPSDLLSLVFLLALMAEGFILQAVRLAGNPDPYQLWSPFGYLLSLPLRGLPEGGLVTTYQIFWWLHLLTTFTWIAWLPYGKMFHLFTSPASIFTANLEPAGVATFSTIDFENVERLGASALTDLSWKDLMDLDACTTCGRCQAVCPAYAAGQPLSPRNLILDLRDHMTRVAAGGPDEGLIGEVIKEETIWACTTCRACMEACPVYVEHVPKIVEMRRHLAMEQGAVPGTLADAMKSLEDRAHPYKGASASRTEWCEGLNIPLASEVQGEIDVLYFVGCTAAFDPRNQKVARAFAQLLQMAGVNFAILGDEESCCGDPARRMGNEFLYDGMARGLIDVLNQYKPKRIVTACPHGMNALGVEYKQFGGDFEVLHHTQLLKELVDSGKLKVRPETHGTVTFHDPCYLGRWNGEYDAPRDLIGATGATQTEMGRNRESSFCCGAGGAHAWLEEHGSGPRINQIRAKEAVETKAETLATSCPFCMQMMEDGVKTVADENGPKVRDVAELLLEAVENTGPDTCH